MEKPRHVHDASAYSAAVAVAAFWHGGQMDDDGRPHLAHVLRVAESLPEHLKPAGVLHDVLEDTNCQFVDVAEATDGRTACIVERLTRGKHEVYADYIKRLGASGDLMAAVREVKIADLKDNLSRSLEEAGWSRVVRYTRALESLAVMRTRE